MKSYTAVYLKHFGYTTADFIECELCQAQGVDVHHIWARSKRPDLINDVRNLMCLCRICHQQYGDKKQHREMLQKVHDKRLNKI